MPEDAVSTTAEQTVTVHIPGRLDFLRVARQATADLCSHAGASLHWASQLEMAIDEACANIIEHSYHHPENNPGIQIALEQYTDRIEAEIQDTGAGFEFENTQPIPPDRYIQEGRSRGLGLHIIRSFVDSVSYCRGTPSGNCLRLIKYFER